MYGCIPGYNSLYPLPRAHTPYTAPSPRGTPINTINMEFTFLMGVRELGGLGGRETVGGGPGYLDYTYWYYYKG